MIGEFFMMLAGGAYVGGKAVGELKELDSNLKRTALIDRYVAEHSDPELEARLLGEIKDPANFNAIWERIEQYKRENGRYYLNNRDLQLWKDVGVKRFKPITSVQTSDLLFLLVSTYDKRTAENAKWFAMNCVYPLNGKY